MKIDPNKIVLKESDIKPDIKLKLLQIKQEKEVTNIEVSVGEGYANEVIAELTQYKEKESTISNTIRKWKQNGDTLKDAIAREKRVTSGLVYVHRKLVLDSEYHGIFIAKR